MAGRAWEEGFVRRDPMTASRKAQNLNPGRAQKLNRYIVNGYFAKRSITMEEPGVMNKPECIYNVNEKGCSLCLHKQHQLYTWLKEMLNGNITRTSWPYYPQGC
jgi:hypothetical protein